VGAFHSITPATRVASVGPKLGAFHSPALERGVATLVKLAGVSFG